MNNLQYFTIEEHENNILISGKIVIGEPECILIGNDKYFVDTYVNNNEIFIKELADIIKTYKLTPVVFFSGFSDSADIGGYKFLGGPRFSIRFDDGENAKLDTGIRGVTEEIINKLKNLDVDVDTTVITDSFERLLRDFREVLKENTKS